MSLEEIYSQPRAATIVRLSFLSFLFLSCPFMSFHVHLPMLTTHQAWFAVLGQHSSCLEHILVMHPCHVLRIEVDPQGAGQGSKFPNPETGQLWLFVTDTMHVAVRPLSLMLHAMSASFAVYLAMQYGTCGTPFVVPD